MAVAIPEQDIGDRTRTEALALELARRFLAEVRAGTSRNRPLTLDSALDDAWGLDSLSRVELAARIEHAFGANLPEQELASAATLRDLLAALRSAAKTSPTAVPAVPPTHWAEAVQAEPVTVATLVEMLDWHVQAHGNRLHIVHLVRPGSRPCSCSAPCVLVANHASYLDGMALFAPTGAADAFAAAATPRDAARAQILAHCGEPDAAEA